MTSRKRKRSALKVSLTRDQVEDLIVLEMGWEREDVAIFWRLARTEARRPGFLAERRRQRMAWLAAILREEGAG